MAKKQKKKNESNSKSSLNKYQAIKSYLNSKYEFRLNTISQEVEYKGKLDKDFRLLNENDLLCELMDKGWIRPQSILLAILKSSFVKHHDPIIEYVKKLPEWKDGKDYIIELASFVNADDQEWFNLQFKKMLVRALACSLHIIPFNKQCFTLQGKQNDGKTSFLRFLCPPQLRNYFKEDLDTHNKDGKVALCQNLFINLDELATFSKQDINKTKAFFTIDKVKERLPYDRRSTNLLRTASFLASTNSGEFLTDTTGNVRWLIFKINSINHDNGGENGYSRKIDIDKVYSQAYSLLKSGNFQYQLTYEDIKYSEQNNRKYQVTSLEYELNSMLKANKIKKKISQAC